MKDLDTYLKKCELEWRAKNLPNGSCVEWLAPVCGDLNELADYLRSLGFKIKEIIDEGEVPGDDFRWVVTTSGIIVYGNGEGLVARACEYRRR